MEPQGALTRKTMQRAPWEGIQILKPFLITKSLQLLHKILLIVIIVIKQEQMKKIFCLALALIALTGLQAQKITSVSFIFVGVESKPIGTLKISVSGDAMPYAKPSDNMFGTGIRTNTETSNLITQYMIAAPIY
jgi:energy-converting hydrogenase Eha subunit F